MHWQEADVTKPSFIPIAEQLKKAWCTVTFSSGTGIDAVINGVSNVACDKAVSYTHLTLPTNREV